jgi:phosphoribosylamine---glycine ligase
VSTNVLVIGSGAREHALAWKLRQSPRVDGLFVGPGNPGTSQVAQNLDLDPFDTGAVCDQARRLGIGLAVIGPEGPLAAGLADALSEAGIPVYGPSRAAAQVESSKSFAKRLMEEAAIPTADSRVFHDYDSAVAYVRSSPSLPVIKADGLAAGKGVTVPADESQALGALRDAMVSEAFGAAGRTVVIEERLYGREVSSHVFSDGIRTIAMPYACDHKAIHDGGHGPNTGGMGAYSPPGFVDERLDDQIRGSIVAPAILRMASRGTPYRGTLYPGLMITDAGPRVIEFNCRFGDPETQVLLPRLASDLFEPLWGAATGDLRNVNLDWRSDTCVAVVLAADGYPGPYRQGDLIEGLDEVDGDVLVFHAGTSRDAGGRLCTAGGRVLTVVALGGDIEAARNKAYKNVERIRFQGKQFRRDIGLVAG